MKFYRPVKTEPQIGQIRERKVFALFPTRINNYIVWLEHYKVIEMFSRHESGGDFDPTTIWEQWTLIEKQLIPDK